MYCARAERGFSGGDSGKHIEKIACGSVEAIQPRHHHHAALVEHFQEPVKLRAVGLGSARHLPQNLRGSGRGKRLHLRRDTLAVHRYPHAAVNHAGDYAHIYRTEKCQ
jgi:hypothetical protein